MYTDVLMLHRNPWQEAAFRSKTSQRPQGERKNYGETSRDTYIGKLTTEDSCAMYCKGSYLSPSVHCKTIKLVSLKKMLTFYQFGILINFYYYFKAKHAHLPKKRLFFCFLFFFFNQRLKMQARKWNKTFGASLSDKRLLFGPYKELF